jgi:hypothetical protein
VADLVQALNAKEAGYLGRGGLEGVSEGGGIRDELEVLWVKLGEPANKVDLLKGVMDVGVVWFRVGVVTELLLVLPAGLGV